MDQNFLTVILSISVIIIHTIYFATTGATITFIDVGQGDGIILTSGSFQMVIDGGPGEEMVSKVARYMNNFDRSIELVVITHWHMDHYFGIHQILKTYNVKEIVLPTDLCRENSEIQMLKNLIKSHGVKVLNSVEVEVNAVNIDVFTNFSSECIRNSKDINNASLVTSIEYNGTKVLLMGDVEKELEMKYAIDSDILKAGHHCSDTSSSSKFLLSVTPNIVVCSFGNNFYGHPSKDVIDRFKYLGINNLSTKEYGDITVNLKSRLIYNQGNKLLMKL